MQDGVLLFDGEWRTAFANQALEHHLGARPHTLGQVYPPSLRGAIQRASETEPGRGRRDRDGCADALAPGDGHAHRHRRVGPGRDRRCDRGAPPGLGSARLRGERVSRVEDAGRVDPGRGRDAPARVAGGPGGGASVRRAARSRGGSALADRRRPAGPVAAGIGQRAGGPGPSGQVGPRRGVAVRGRGDRRGAHDGGPGRAGSGGPWFGARPLLAGPQPVGQRRPLHEGGRAPWSHRCRRTTDRSSCACATPGPGSPRRSSPACSSASIGWTGLARARPAAPVSDSPSFGMSPRTTAAP